MRPSAERIMGRDLDDYYLDILESQGYWILTYQGRPVSIRRTQPTVAGTRLRYPRTGWNNRAHAEHTAHKLNKIFNTDEFGSAEVKL